LVAGYTGCTEALEQPRRAGQHVGQDAGHGVFDFLGWQPPALGAIRSRLADQRSGGSRPVYGWFTEGFDTADLKSAEAFVRELA
jgi:hypothetical protein